MRATLKRKLSVFFWLLITLVCVVYAPMAAEYFLHYFIPDTANLWLHLFTWVAGEHHTLGPGSVEVVQQVVYTQSRLPMLLHTAAGGTAILLMALQFYKPLRQKHPNIHRMIGRLIITVVILSMIGSMIFLVVSGAKNSFNGLPFYLQLWLLALGTLGSAILGVIAIVKKQVHMHQAAMIYLFSMLLSAPVLRIEWLFIGGLFNVTQQTSNLFSALIFGYLVVPCAIVATRLTDFRAPSTWPISFKAVSRIDLLFVGIGLAAMGVISFKYVLQIGIITSYTICLITLALVTMSAYVMAWLASIQAQNMIALKEWQIHIRTYCISPLVFLVVWQILCSFTTVYEAFEAASFTTFALTFTLGYLLMAITRKASNSRILMNQ